MTISTAALAPIHPSPVLPPSGTVIRMTSLADQVAEVFWLVAYAGTSIVKNVFRALWSAA